MSRSDKPANRLRIVGFSFILLLTACSFFSRPLYFSSRGEPTFGSNGERIYFTATTINGERIRYSGGPAFGGMMMGPVTCAACHGPDAQGGQHLMHMDLMDAPDIRWNTLSSSEHGDHAEDEHDEAAYDEQSFLLALREGVTPGGHRLSREMPRWEIEEGDAGDLMDYLKILE